MPPSRCVIGIGAFLCLLGCESTNPSGFNDVVTPFEPDVEWFIEANPYSTFSALVEVTPDEDLTTWIEYTVQGEEFVQRTPEYSLDRGDTGYILVLGLLAEREYALWVAAAHSDGRTWASGREHINTEPAPPDWRRDECTVTMGNFEDFDPHGVICTGTGENTNPHYFYCVNRDGEPVWEIAKDDRSHMMTYKALEDGGYAAIGCWDHVVLFDRRGRMEELLEGSFLEDHETRFSHDFIDHHEVIEITEGRWAGSIAFLTRSFDKIVDGDHPEEANHGGAGIVIYSPDRDEVLWDWSCHGETGDNIPIDPLLDYSWHGLLPEGHNGEDWHHANTLVHEMDGDDEYFWISLRNQEQVVKVDADTDRVLWRLGYGGDFDLVENFEDPVPADPLLWFYHQHTPKIMKVGSDGRKDILIYDNGSARVDADGQHHTGSRYSRVVEFKIDESTLQAVPVFAHGNPEGEGEDFWWTGIYGGASMLPDKEALVFTQGNYPILVDIEYPSGRERWRYECPYGNFYRADYFPTIYDMTWTYQDL